MTTHAGATHADAPHADATHADATHADATHADATSVSHQRPLRLVRWANLPPAAPASGRILLR
jgi:hypothetical protein